MVIKLPTVFLLLAISVRVWAQSADAQLQFLSDSLHIGKACSLRLEVSHPPDMQVLPGQSAEDFFPFELLELLPEPTRTEKNTSFDAITYVLKSFDVAPYQQVRIPLTVIQQKDTHQIQVQSNRIPLASRIVDPSGNLVFKRHEGLEEITPPIRWDRVVLSLLLASFLLYGLWRLLRSPWQRFQQLRKIRREWRTTRQSMYAIKNISWQPEVFMNELNVCWKKFLDPMHPKSLLSLTTTELGPVLNSWDVLSPQSSQALLRCAKIGDQVIHGGERIPQSQALFLWEDVYEVMIEIYNVKESALKESVSDKSTPPQLVSETPS